MSRNTFRVAVRWMGIALIAPALLSFSACQPDTEQYVAPNVLDLDPCVPAPEPSPDVDDFGGWIGVRVQARTDSQGVQCRPAEALLSFEGSITEFGLQSVNSLTTRFISITNLGLSSAQAISVDALIGRFRFVGGAFPGHGGTCGQTLEPGAKCLLAIQFAPLAIAHEKSSLVIHYDSSAGAKVLGAYLTGTGVAYPTLSFQEETGYNFGPAVVSQAREHLFTVRYTGVHPATGVSPVALSGSFQFTGGSYPGTGGTCGAEIAANCTISVTFTSASLGQASDVLKLNYSNGAFAAAAQVALSGQGIAAPTPALLTLIPAPGMSQQFGAKEIGSENPLKILVKNSGSLPATSLVVSSSLNGAFSFEGGSFPGTSGNCGTSVENECSIAVVFRPSAAAIYQNTLALSYLDGLNPQPKQAQLILNGRGQKPAVLSISGSAPVDFGTAGVGGSVRRRLTLTNASSEVTISGLAPESFELPYSIAGTNCGTSLAAAQSCWFDVDFAPQAAGEVRDAFVIRYVDGFHLRAAEMQLVGRGTDAAVLTMSPLTQDFGTPVVGLSKTIVFQVKYAGLKPATGITWSNLAGPDFFYDGGTCSTLIHQDCTVAIKFMPTIRGQVNTPVLLLYSDGYGPQAVTLNLSGKGMQPAALTLSHDPVEFGSVAVGAVRDFTLRVTNTGDVAASALNIAAIPAPFSRAGGTCGTSLGAAQTCTVQIRFNPSALGHFEKALNISYHNGLGSVALASLIKGDATGTPEIGVIVPGGGTQGQAASYDFGALVVGASKSASFNIAYAGLNPAVVTGLTQLNGPDFFYESGSCSTSQISQSCTFSIRFQPSIAGALQSVFQLSYDDGTGTSKAIQINLKGKGLRPALLSFVPAEFVFEATPLRYTRAQNFTIANAANAEANASISPIGTLSAPFQVLSGTCIGTSAKILAPGATCTLRVSFQPQSAGPFSATLPVNYNNGAVAQSVGLSLSGSGVEDALLAANASSLSFGNVATGATKSLSLTLSYYGSRAATLTSVSAGAPFELQGGFPGGGTCGNSISGNCTVMLTFKPQAEGLLKNSFSLNYDDGAGHAKSVLVNLSGTGIAPAVLSMAPVDFGNVRIGEEALLNVSVNYSGSEKAGQLTISQLSDPFSILGHDCGANVVASCNIQLRFRPIAEGQFANTLTLNYFNGVSGVTASTQVRARGYRQALLRVEAPSSFGKVAFGTEAQKSFLLVNHGTRTAEQLVFNTSGANFRVLSHDCGASLPQGASCKVGIAFRSVRPGSADEKATVQYNDGVSQFARYEWTLSGIATVPVQIATKGDHNCAITETAAVKCWGRGEYGQTAGGVVNLGENVWAAKIATGYWHSCAVLNDGSVKCWGKNDHGQLGIGDVRNRGLDPAEMGDALPKVNLGSGAVATAITAGYAHTCALLAGGAVKCWGQNQMGQLGLGDLQSRGGSGAFMGDALAAVALGTGKKAVEISASVGHTCAVLEDRSLKCWGDNFYGQLGLGDFAIRGGSLGQMGDALPTIDLGAEGRVSRVATGGASTCVVLENATLKCWGLNYHGNLGTCWALDEDGNVGSCLDGRYRNWTRGYGLAAGQMGEQLPVVELGDAFAVSKIASGAFFSCAVSNTGAVKCFGENSQGQLGTGDSEPRGDHPNEMGDNLPTPLVLGGAQVRDIAAGNEHVCAVLQNDTIRCWGADGFGQLEQ